MLSKQEQLRKYIEQSVGTVCPYTDATRNRLYRIGFLESFLACLFIDDPIILTKFKQKIEELKDE
jgi:hypothetical protein